MGKTKATKEKVKEEYDVGTIVAQIRSISEAMTKLKSGRLNERAIVILLKDSTQMSGASIKKVLKGLSELEKDFIKMNSKGEE